jgi:membrane dipeptidase
MAVASPPPIVGITLTAEQERRAVALHRSSIVVDCSSVLKQEPSHIERARAGGVTVTNHTVTRVRSDLPQALREINMCRRWIDQNPNDVLLCLGVEDIHEAKRSDREAIVFGPQNTEFLGTDLDFVGTFYDLGVRIMQLTYQRQNWVGSGCGERRDGGLTTFGRKVVSLMDDLGMVVDISHCGHVTGMDAIEHSRNPVLLTHAHPAALSPHVRAKSDDLIKALAARGGVIGLTALSAFNHRPEQPLVRPGLDRWVEHVRYLVDLVGIDHVGIGLDFDETNTPEKWAADHAAQPELKSGWSWEDRRIHDLTHAGEEVNVTRALVWGGFSDAEIEKILGANFLRVFKQVWKS